MLKRRKVSAASGTVGSKHEEKFIKHYSTEELDLMRSHDTEKLKSIVAECNAHVMKSKKEVEDNVEYQAAAEVLKVFREGLNEVKKYSDSKRVMALMLLQSKGIVDCGSEDEAE